MPPRFFLSYARANNGTLVRKFFDDLCLTISGALGLPRSAAVGFYEEIEYGPGDTWTAGAEQALQSCTAMICLLSPAYFHSERAGKEWKVFDTRRKNYPSPPAPEILPVSWIATNGPVPQVVSDVRSRPDTIHQRRPIVTMLKSASLGEYNEFVKTLAYKIIDATAQVAPLPLALFPSMPDVQNAFYLWDEPAITGSKFNDGCKRFELYHGNRENVNVARVRDHVTQQTASESPNQQNQPTLQNKYLTYAISESSDFLDMVEDRDPFRFKVIRHENPEHAVYRIQQLISQERDEEVPELFVIDLDSGKESPKAAKDLYEEWDVPAGILAVSSRFDRGIWDELKGATPLLGRFDPHELTTQMQICANIGRSIRTHRNEKRLGLDPTRDRQVFLSYRSLDKGLATVLRRSLEARKIGVSYMDEEDAAGKWKDNIEVWISQAQIFLALVTENYLTSKYCEAELRRFTHDLNRVESNPKVEKRTLELIMNMYNLPHTHKNDLVEECKKEYQYLSMSDANFPIALKRLVVLIQNLLRKPAA